MTLKRCSCCKAFKAHSEFGKQTCRNDGLRPYCKECTKAKNAIYEAKNKEKRSIQSAEYYRRTIEQQRAYDEKNRAKQREYFALYRIEHREKRAAMKAASYIKHRARVLAKSSAWQKANREKRRATDNNRRARKLQAGGKHTSKDIEQIAKLQRYKCAVCKTCIKQKRHVDHVMPLARGGGNGPDNLQLLCPPCNLSKNAKHPVDFMQEKGYLL